MDLKNNRRGRIKEYADKFKKAIYSATDKKLDHNWLWNIKADCAFPSATQNEINAKDAANLIKNGVKVVSEGANMPSTLEATKAFLDAKVQMCIRDRTTVSDLDVFVPVENRYYRGKDIPVPVADAVVGLYRDRYIFLIGGWSTSKNDTVRNVQIYDTDKDTWMQATPIPGAPVFGHAGAIIGDVIVYVDGAYKNASGIGPKYLTSNECWVGEIPNSKKGDITKIEWTKLPPHPGNARYRIAAGAGPVLSLIHI